MAQEQSKRVEWIDFLRGIAMLLVIWGHVDRTHQMYFVITGPFKMPLFFAISGYLFKDRDGNTKVFFGKLFRSIIVPWIILSLVWIKPIYYIVQGKPELIWTSLSGFISGKDFWYIPCILIAETIFFLITKYIHRTHIQVLAMIAISCIGFVLGEYNIGRFAMFSVACTSQIFLLFGHWYKNAEIKICRRNTIPIILSLFVSFCVLITLSIRWFPGQTIDIHTGKYYNVPFCIVLIFNSLLLLFMTASRYNLRFRWINFVGRNTLIFYIVHYHARTLIRWVLNKFDVITNTLPAYIGIFVIICALMSFTALIIRKWFPFVLGTWKKKG